MRKCCVIGCCNDKTKSNCRDKTFFSFPLKNSQLLQLWLKSIGRENFTPSSNSVICSDHFQENSFTICPFTKRRILKQEAVPFVFQKTPKVKPKVNLLSILTKGGTKPRLPGSVGNSPSLASSEPSSTRENHEDKGKIKETENLKPGVESLQKQIKKEECEQFPAIQKPYEKSNLPNPKYLTVISNKNVILLPLHVNQASTTISRSEPQNAAEMSTVIKQEPDECADEPPQLVIEKVLGAEEILSSSRSSASSGNLSSACGSTPFLENSLPFGSHGSTYMNETSATNILNKSAQKGKVNGAEPDAAQTQLCQHTKPSKLSSIHILRPTHVLHPLDSKETAVTSKKSTRRVPNATEAKLCRRTKLSMPDKTNMKRKLDPPAENPKKFEGYLGESGDVGHRHPALPTQNDETSTREIFQSLFDGSNNNSLFTSRTAERPGDLFDVFADFIASKLRVMDWDECAYALRAVLDIVTQTGKVEHNSEVKSEISSLNTSSIPSNQE